jgi:periplasmic divalent cation tolerance protein
MDFIQVSTTMATREVADTIARALLDNHLAACVQVVGPIKSTYWWQGVIEESEEWLCLIKTTQSLYDEVEQTISRLHPYKTPEIVATPIVNGSKSYLGWIRDETMAR